MNDREDPTRFTHFEPLSPTLPSSHGGVFNFIGRFFRPEAETAPSSNNSDSQSQSGEGENAVVEEVGVQAESPNDVKKVSNGGTGHESNSSGRGERRRQRHPVDNEGVNVNPSSWDQLPHAAASAGMSHDFNGQSAAGRSERMKPPFSMDANSPRPQSLGVASPAARREMVGAEQGGILRQVPKSRRWPFRHLLRMPVNSGMASASSMESIDPGLMDYNRSDFRQYWMPDSRGKECYECQEKFTTFRRRHHCRICGQIFCAKCCNKEVPGALLGYMGDLRLCNYCSKAVVSYLSTSDGDRGRSPSPLEDEPHIVRKDSSASVGSTIRTTASSADIATVSGAIMWSPPEQHTRSSASVEGPTVLSVLDLAAGVRQLHEPVQEEPILAQAVDEWEPEWVKSIDISDKRNNKSMDIDVCVEKSEPFGDFKSFGHAAAPNRSQPLSISITDEPLSIARSLPVLAPIPASPTVTEAIDSALSPVNAGESVNLPILYESQAMRLLQYVLERENLDCERWVNVIWPLSREIAYTVHPNVRDRRDDMDILSYIHVKKLLTSREKPTAQVVFGTVCSKAVADSRMKQHFTQPSVMIIGGSIEYERVGGKFSSIDPIIMQETEYLKNIVARLSARQPNIVVVEKTVARLALKFLRRANITVLFNLKSAVMKRIARCTQADVTPSVDSQILQPKLGSCGSFRSETVCLLNGDTKSLVYLDDCQPDLCCSIVLHGADPRELRAAKRVIRFMVSVLYSAKLETEMLTLNAVCIEPEHGGLCNATDCSVCVLNADDAFAANDDGNPESLAVAGQSAVLTSSPLIMFGLPMLETKRGRDCRLTAYFKQPLYRFRHIGSLTRPRSVTPEPAAPLPPKRQIELTVTSDTTHSFVGEKLTGLDLAGIANFRAKSGRLFRKRFANALTKDGRSVLQPKRDGSPTSKKRLPLPVGPVDVLSPYYHQRIAVLFGSYSTKSANAPLFCVRPWVVWMEYYGVHDMCLGEFLRKFCFNKEYQCPSTNCDVPMLDHARKIVHRRVCIEITTQTIMEQDQPGSIPLADADNTMLTWDWCSKCKHTTKALPVSDKLWHLSFAKYLDYLSSGRHLRSHAVGTNTVAICSHCMFHEHDHYFVLNNFVTCFKLSPIRPFEVTFSPMICKVKPSVVPAQSLFDSARSLSDKVADVFGTMVDRRNRFIQNPEATRYAATVAMLATVLDEAQDTFRLKMSSLQDHLSSLDGRMLGSNDAHFIKANDNLTVCEQLIAHAVSQWNVCAADFVQAVKTNRKVTNSSSNVLTDLPKDIGAKSYSAPILELAAPTDERALKELDEKARQLSPAKLLGPLELTSLVYPFNRGEHFELPFGRIPVVIRDLVDTKTCQADIGSIIAYALASPEYDSKRQRLRDTWGQDGVALSLKRTSLNDSNEEQQTLVPSDTAPEASGLEDSASQHIELQFADATVKYYCKVYYAEHFRLLRKLLFAEGEDAFVRSLSRSTNWDPQGGKSGASFYRTEDGRFVFKQMSRFEIQSFLKFAPNYFHYVSTAATENKLTTLCKVYGVFRIGYKNFQTGQQLKLDVLVMEYLFYRRNVKQVWDLKGSQRNRMASEKPTSDLVLLDENLLKDLWNNQLYVHPHSKTALSMAISNDSHFLSGQLVMDYSLLVGVDEERQELVLGIVDYMRTYTLDKKLESWVKIVAVPGAHLPTVISPEMYCSRFSEAIDTYFPVAPDQWTGLGYGMPY